MSLQPNPPRLTRIVTVFEQWDCVAPWLKKDSLFPQGTEWILVNDSVHLPPPAPVAADIAARGIRLITPPRNLGVSAARNLGLQHATGEWVDFVDGDDLPLPLDLTDVPLDADLVFFPTAGHYNPEQLAAHLAFEGRMKSRFFTPKDYMFIYPENMRLDMKVSSILWSRSVVLSLGGFDSRYDSAEDMELLWLAARRNLRTSKVDFCKQSYRFMQNSERKQLFRHYALFRFFKKILPLVGPAERPHAEKRTRDFLFSVFWSVVPELSRHGVSRKALFKEGFKLMLLAFKRSRP